MNIFLALKNLDWKSFNIMDVVNGCSDAYLGDWNVFNTPERREFLKRVSIGRLKHCSKCHMNVDGWCDNTGKVKIKNVDTKEMVKGCGCNIRCKSVTLSNQCPAGLWKSIQYNP